MEKEAEWISLRDLIEKMLDVDSEKRISLKGIFEHEWMKGEVYGDRELKELCEEIIRKSNEGF